MPIVKKEASFDDHWGNGWPDITIVDQCLTDPEKLAQLFAKGRDGGCFSIEWIYDEDNSVPQFGVVGAILYMHMNPDHGIKLQYSGWDRCIGERKTYHSKGDLTKLKQFVRSFHRTPLSIGLFVPFETGRRAVKEFLETDGELPRSVDWILDDDLTPDVFPLP
ncbi:MAG TPA: Imm1 family immunity protein [Pseudolabrys sp.]|nr:Imm1 family immunity protein [Pseudolabrys sp.]